ncbi:MAG: carboxypeptidase regulatory-like domain-containing protein, partial [Xanthomonadales bacterium]|nr:carboxypeptidase regulatory-like domain-containing protein [Xanthomonadales bacterium]
MAAHGATVNGQVRRSDTNAPIAGAFVSLLLLSENGDLVQFVNAQTDAGGNYSRGGLGDGDWRAFASATGFASEAYLEIPCPPGGCFLFFPGTFIPLAGAQVVNGIDFTLEPNGTLTGVVRRADTQVPLANVDVLAVTASVGFVAGGVSDANGVYTMSVP